MTTRLLDYERLLAANARGDRAASVDVIVRAMIRDLVSTMTRIEAITTDFDAEVQAFRDRSLQRVAETIDPVIAQAQQQAGEIAAYLATLQAEGLAAGLVTVEEDGPLAAGTAQAALAALAATLASHGHGIEAIDGLAAALAGKATASHTHPISAISGLSGQLNGKAALGVGSLLVLTTSQTWAVPSAARRLRITAVGGGGGGGGARTTALEEVAIGGGGGAGGEAIRWLEAPLPVSLVITIGAGGAAGSSSGSGSNGGTGGTTTVEVGEFDVVSAGGGSGGNASGVLTGPFVVQGGAGGAASGGTINREGERGWLGALVEPTRNHAWAGRGGSGSLGRGGIARESSSASSRVGDPGTGYGSGGGGAISKSSGTADPQVGGIGAPGVVVVEWWR